MRRLSSTVRPANSRRPSGTWAMPRATTWCDGTVARSTPSMTIRPRRGDSSFEMTRSSVVLPAPFGPITATASPADTWSETPNSA